MKKSIKIISLALISLIVIGALLAGCGGNANNGKNSGGKADSDKVYELKLATVVSEPHPWIEMGNFFAEEVEKKTDGKVKIKVHHSGTLGNDETTIDEMRLGTIDFVIGGTQNAASFVPEYQIFGLSYLFSDMRHFENVIAGDSEVFRHFQKLYEDKGIGIRLLALAGGGTRNVSNNLRPIVTPEDMRGMKMRLPGSPLEAKLWSAAGAIPTSLPWNEIYSAIQTGVVNSFESTISGFYGSKLFEVAKYFAKTEHLYMLTHFSMSDIAYNKLPEEYRNIIEEVALEAALLGTEKGKQFDEEKLAEMIENNGLLVNEVERDQFIERLSPLHDELAKDIKAEDILEMIRKN